VTQAVLDIIVRAIVWIVAVTFWTSLNKPDGVGVIPAWAGAPTIVGTIIVIVGLALYGAAALVLARAPKVAGGMPEHLFTQGPFAYVRNPLYLGIVIITIGLTFVYRMPAWTFVKLAVLFVAGHFAVVLLEEPKIRARFGPAYDDYCRRVPRWIPRQPSRA
jgi:protein-S-isoprenylcysteine O-methyltransferase Ste14